MRCAFEVAVDWQKNYKASELVRLEKLCREDEKFLQQVARNSVDFCENVIAPELEVSAKQGCYKEMEVPFALGLYRHYYEGYCKYDVFYGPYIKTNIKYSNGRPSYRIDTDKLISLKAIEKYLNKYCYSISIKENHNIYKQFGGGWLEGILLTVKVDPQCKKEGA